MAQLIMASICSNRAALGWLDAMLGDADPTGSFDECSMRLWCSEGFTLLDARGMSSVRLLSLLLLVDESSATTDGLL